VKGFEDGFAKLILPCKIEKYKCHPNFNNWIIEPFCIRAPKNRTQ